MLVHQVLDDVCLALVFAVGLELAVQNLCSRLEVSFLMKLSVNFPGLEANKLLELAFLVDNLFLLFCFFLLLDIFLSQVEVLVAHHSLHGFFVLKFIDIETLLGATFIFVKSNVLVHEALVGKTLLSI